MARWMKVGAVGEIPPGEAMAVDCGREVVAVFNVAGAFYAVSDSCPHAGGSLSQGWVEGLEVQCPWHGWGFDLAPKSDPGDGVCRYPVRVEDDEIFIEVPD